MARWRRWRLVWSNEVLSLSYSRISWCGTCSHQEKARTSGHRLKSTSSEFAEETDFAHKSRSGAENSAFVAERAEGLNHQLEWSLEDERGKVRTTNLHNTLQRAPITKLALSVSRQGTHFKEPLSSSLVPRLLPLGSTPKHPLDVVKRVGKGGKGQNSLQRGGCVSSKNMLGGERATGKCRVDKKKENVEEEAWENKDGLGRGREGWYTEGLSVRIIFTEKEEKEEEKERGEGERRGVGEGDASLIRRRRGNEKWGIDGARQGRK
ncbi:hypothetical protein DBV15_03711 [Temnothorax longispinosus]|uniref:Uncharacterized protein n=1 Tax=Temnothorax longispinosus TaxID=300112 RepID=A0A4S2KIE6_9HYME|nr:hypothetical protein DBV15_03711 [Temnothorax longispinosus]